MNKRATQIALLFAVLCSIVVGQDVYYLDSVNGNEAPCGDTIANACLGLFELPPLTDAGTTLIFAAGTYPPLENFPFPISNQNVVFQGTDNVIFECDTAATSSCITIVAPRTSSIISFQNITFTGFAADENTVSSMITISSSFPVNGYHPVYHQNSSVQFSDCIFNANTNAVSNYTWSPTDPPTHHPHHFVQLININGVSVGFTGCTFSFNTIQLISATYAQLHISDSLISSNFANYSTQLISTVSSLLSIDGSYIEANGAGGVGALFTIEGALCSLTFSNYISTECQTNSVINTQIKNNNNLGVIFYLLDGAWISMSNSNFSSNAAQLSISTAYSPVPSVIQLAGVSFLNNAYGFVSALFAEGSTIDYVTVDTTNGADADMLTFFDILSGSILTINNLQYNSAASPFNIYESTVRVNNSVIVNTGKLIPNIGSEFSLTTVYFQNTQFTFPYQLATVYGITTIFFDGCTFSESEQISLTCQTDDPLVFIFFIGAENTGFGLNMCTAYCDSTNEDICPSGDNIINCSSSGGGGSASEIIAWILVAILFLVVVALVGVLGFIGYKWKKSVSYDSLN